MPSVDVRLPTVQRTPPELRVLFSIFTNYISTYLPHGRLESYADDTQLLDSNLPNDLSLLITRQEETFISIQSYVLYHQFIEDEPNQNQPPALRHLPLPHGISQ